MSQPQVRVLSEYSYGLVLAGRCGLTSVSLALALQLQESFETVRERLRDFYCAAADKSGRQRCELPVRTCFAPLLAWVLAHWQGTDLALALDGTALRDQWTILTVSVLYRGSAIPVAWKVLPATQKGRWKPHWIDLLTALKTVVPAGWRVLVLADRGLYAQWLYQAIVDLHWHPFLRITSGHRFFKPQRHRDFLTLATCLAGPGMEYRAAGVMFKSPDAQLPTTVASCWRQGAPEGWFVLTDLPPHAVSATWYALRGWIERGYKHTKSGGWHWQETRMADPARAAHLWLVMAVADLYVLRHGACRELTAAPPPTAPARGRPALASRRAALPPAPAPANPLLQVLPSPGKRRRVLSVFRVGMLLLQALLFLGIPWPPTPFQPEPWPAAITSSHPP